VPDAGCVEHSAEEPYRVSVAHCNVSQHNPLSNGQYWVFNSDPMSSDPPRRSLDAIRYLNRVGYWGRPVFTFPSSAYIFFGDGIVSATSNGGIQMFDFNGSARVSFVVPFLQGEDLSGISAISENFLLRALATHPSGDIWRGRKFEILSVSERRRTWSWPVPNLLGIDRVIKEFQGELSFVSTDNTFWTFDLTTGHQQCHLEPLQNMSVCRDLDVAPCGENRWAIPMCTLRGGAGISYRCVENTMCSLGSASVVLNLNETAPTEPRMQSFLPVHHVRGEIVVLLLQRENYAETRLVNLVSGMTVATTRLECPGGRVLWAGSNDRGTFFLCSSRNEMMLLDHHGRVSERIHFRSDAGRADLVLGVELLDRDGHQFNVWYDNGRLTREQCRVE
jgi:hypothetical protein